MSDIFIYMQWFWSWMQTCSGSKDYIFCMFPFSFAIVWVKHKTQVISCILHDHSCFSHDTWHYSEFLIFHLFLLYCHVVADWQWQSKYPPVSCLFMNYMIQKGVTVWNSVNLLICLVRVKWFNHLKYVYYKCSMWIENKTLDYHCFR